MRPIEVDGESGWGLRVMVVAVVAGVGLAWIPELRAENSEVEAELEAIQQELDQEAESSGDTGVASKDTGADAAGGPAAGESVETEASVKSSAESSEEPSFWANWELYRDPMLVGLIAGGVLAFLGVYVVARRIVFVSAALSQVSALGVTAGFLVTSVAGLSGVAAAWLPPVFAIGLALVVVFALTWVGDTPSLPRDSVLGTSFVVPMALVLVLAPYIAQEMHQIESLLHGSAVVVRKQDLWAIIGSAVLILGAQAYAFRGFIFVSLDPKVARTQGLPVGALNAVLFGSIALMTGLATRAIGALPTFGLTLLPALGALGLNVGLAAVFVVALVLGAISGGGGYMLAYEFGWSVGAAQTLLAAGLMVAVRGWQRMIG